MLNFYAPDELPEAELHSVVIVPGRGGEWLFLPPEQGWDLPCGSVLPGESPEDAARRVLSGFGLAATELQRVHTFRDGDESGALFFADVTSAPEALLRRSVPPQTPARDEAFRLFTRVQWWLNLRSSPDEVWDVYDSERRLTGRTHRRGQPMRSGDHHLVVHAWLQTPDGRFLLTRRAPNKGYPNLWECTGGSALTGDDSLSAVLREIREETGLVAEAENGKMLLTIRRDDHFLDLWSFRQDFRLEDVTLLPGETTAARLVTLEELLELRRTGELVPYDYFDELFGQFFLK